MGCHASTGAGGATVWDHAGQLLLLTIASNPFVRLPRQAGMRVAALRCTRVGGRAGLPVEDYGVVPDHRYYMTRADVVLHNEDLIAAAARILDQLPKQTLRLTPIPANPAQQFTVDCTNIDRLDLLVNDRPVQSQNVTPPSFIVSLPNLETGNILTARGYREGTLVTSTRLRI